MKYNLYDMLDDLGIGYRRNVTGYKPCFTPSGLAASLRPQWVVVDGATYLVYKSLDNYFWRGFYFEGRVSLEYHIKLYSKLATETKEIFDGLMENWDNSFKELVHASEELTEGGKVNE